AVLCDLRLVLVQVALCWQVRHGRLLEWKDCADIDKSSGNESAVFRLMWLKQKQLCWLDGGETTGDARAAGQDIGALDGCRGQRVIGIERIAFGMGDDHIWRQLANQLRESLQDLRVNLKRIIAEIETLERVAEYLVFSSGLFTTNSISISFRA